MPEAKVDVLIIGSGHSGGMMAKILTEKGISCVMLNAGPIVDFQKDRELKPAYELPYRGFNIQGGCNMFFRRTSSTPIPGSMKKKFPTHTTKKIPTTGCGCGCSVGDPSSGLASPSV